MKNTNAIKSRSRNVSELIPKDFHWKLLSSLVADNAGCLSKDELNEVLGIIRSREPEKVFLLADLWSPQSMAHCGLGVEEFHAKYQIGAFLKKFQFPGSKESRQQVALAGFLHAEDTCREFNSLKYLELESLSPTVLSESSLPLMRQFIEGVLGSTVDLDTIAVNSRHGPGSSLCTTKGRVSAYYKYADLPYTVTAQARPYARALILSDERWYGALQEDYRDRHGIPYHFPISVDAFFEDIFKIAPGNRITFVPKDGRKDRPIAIEPRLNLMLQLGVDGAIRRSLKRFGCDLDTQEKNQRFAKLGSTYTDERRFSTIDLSAASDSVSLKLCEILLPSEWYALLLDLRSPYGEVTANGSAPFSIEYEKISSMGNGFTFALESLIFLAAAYAATRISNPRWNLKNDVAVFGDDIVVPSDSALALIEILETCGFSVNTSKSFVLGEFKESCGCDYYKGTMVRPIHLNGGIKDVKELFSIINRSSYVHYQKQREEGLEFSYSAFHLLAKGWLPTKWKHFVGPPSCTEFDTYLHLPRSEALSGNLIRYRRSVYDFKRLVTVPLGKKGNKFLFRKLMASLRQGPSDTLPIWGRKMWDPTASGGSVFTVTERNALSVRVVSSQTSFWFEDYSYK